MEIVLEDIIVYTLTGKKHLYKLWDGTYGQWLIFKDRIPMYYLDIWDDMYSGIHKLKYNDPVGYLSKKFKIQKEGYDFSQHLHGIWSSKVNYSKFDIEKLPVSFFDD